MFGLVIWQRWHWGDIIHKQTWETCSARCCMIHYQNLSRDAAIVSLLQRLSPQRCMYMYNVFMPPALTKTTAVCRGMRSCWNLRAATKSWRMTSLLFSLNTQRSRHFAETANLICQIVFLQGCFQEFGSQINCLVQSVIENHRGKNEVLYKKVMEIFSPAELIFCRWSHIMLNQDPRSWFQHLNRKNTLVLKASSRSPSEWWLDATRCNFAMNRYGRWQLVLLYSHSSRKRFCKVWHRWGKVRMPTCRESISNRNSQLRKQLSQQETQPLGQEDVPAKVMGKWLGVDCIWLYMVGDFPQIHRDSPRFGLPFGLVVPIPDTCVSASPWLSALPAVSSSSSSFSLSSFSSFTSSSSPIILPISSLIFAFSS